jgi:hypothetical protein
MGEEFPALTGQTAPRLSAMAVHADLLRRAAGSAALLLRRARSTAPPRTVAIRGLASDVAPRDPRSVRNIAVCARTFLDEPLQISVPLRLRLLRLG